MVLGREGWNQVDQLEDDAAKTPNICFLVVLLFVNLLRTHVVRRADVCLGQFRIFIVCVSFDYARESEVSKLDVVVRVEEYVAWLEVSMKDLVSLDSADVTLSQSKQNLHEDFPDYVFGDKVLFYFALLDQL